VVKALGLHVQQSVTCSEAGVQTSAWLHLPIKELFLLIPTHMMNRVIIRPGKRGFNSVLYKLTIADTLISSVNVLAGLAWLKQIDWAGHWLVHHTAPVGLSETVGHI